MKLGIVANHDIPLAFDPRVRFEAMRGIPGDANAQLRAPARPRQKPLHGECLREATRSRKPPPSRPHGPGEATQWNRGQSRGSTLLT